MLAQKARRLCQVSRLPAEPAENAGSGPEQGVRSNEGDRGHERSRLNHIGAWPVEIILVSRRRSGIWQRAHLGGWAVVMLVVVGAGLIPLSAWLSYRLALEHSAPRNDVYAAAWAGEVETLRREVAQTRHSASENLDALALRLGELQARVLRLDALGHRLVGMAELDPGEFDFSARPALGGLRPAGGGESRSVSDFLDELDVFARQLEDRAPKLDAIESTLMSARLRAEVSPSGWPIRQGWLSSAFGWRNDPISGKRAFHGGVDFSGPYRSDVVAVAAGIVTRAEENSGNYGNMVEVDHGDGYATRYAHNAEILVAPGEKVSRGQPIALLGNSGRSTGPHVHFEVRLDGKAINPIEFVRP